MDICNHVWEPRSAASTNGTTRYECALCGCWGHRKWTVRWAHLIQLYILQGEPRMKPDPLWFLEYREPRNTPKGPPQPDDVGLIESLTPSDRKWHGPR